MQQVHFILDEQWGEKKNKVLKLVSDAEKIQKKYNYDWVEEIYAIADEINIPHEELMAMTLLYSINFEDIQKEECTLWMAVGNSSYNGESLLAMNIDAPAPANIHIKQPNGKFKYISTGRFIFNAPPIFINEKGVSIVTATGEPLMEVNPDNVGLSWLYIMRMAAENVTCCEEVLEIYEKVNKDRLFKRRIGFISCVVDKEKGLLIEMTAEHMNYKWIKNSIWISPSCNFGLPKKALTYVEKPTKIGAFTRYLKIAEILEKNKGKITPSLLKKVGRNTESILQVEGSLPVCRNKTTVSFIASISKEYPEILSTAWVSVGNPGTIPYVPFPMGIKGIHKKFVSGEVGEMSNNVFKKYGNSNKFHSTFEELEIKMGESLQVQIKKVKNLLEKNKTKDIIEDGLTDITFQSSEMCYQKIKSLI